MGWILRPGSPPATSASTGEARAAVTMLCLPGTMLSPLIFEQLATRLDMPVEVVPWLEWHPPHDLPTIARTVRELVHAHRPSILLGHSTGGIIALSAALQAAGEDTAGPDLQGVVVCASGANMAGHGDVDAIVERVRFGWGPALWAAMADRAVHYRPSPTVMASLAEYPAHLSPTAVAEVLHSQRSTDLHGQLGRLGRLPVLVVHGQHDPVRSPAHAHTLAASLENAEVAILDAGHTPPLEHPNGFARVVQGWLDRVVAPAPPTGPNDRHQCRRTPARSTIPATDSAARPANTSGEQ